MRHLKSGIILAGVAALSLSGCSKKTDEMAKTDTAAAPAATTVAPRHKAGLWQQVATVDGISTPVSKICIDDVTSAQIPVDGTTPGVDCPKSGVTRTATGYTISSQCNMGSGGVVSTEGTVTGDYDTAYEMTATITTTGAAVAHMNTTRKVIVSGKRLGDCAEGMKAGDQELPDGTTINMSGYDPAKAKAIAEAAKKAGAQ